MCADAFFDFEHRTCSEEATNVRLDSVHFDVADIGMASICLEKNTQEFGWKDDAGPDGQNVALLSQSQRGPRSGIEHHRDQLHRDSAFRWMSVAYSCARSTSYM